MKTNDWLDRVREDYGKEGEAFRYRNLPEQPMGYFVEPWSNACFVGPSLESGQPEPISLDWEDERIAEQEEAIRRWIAAVGHALVIADCSRQCPAGWTVVSGSYEPDWPECEFGASVVVFAITPATAARERCEA